MEITYAVTDSAIGRLLIGATSRGVCAISLGDNDADLAAVLRDEYPEAVIRRDDAAFPEWVTPIVRHLAGEQADLHVPVDVRATDFQDRVWAELRAIPYGTTRTYRQVAEALGEPMAFRAVGHACATNPVAVVIPCHRVVRADGGLGGYRWGLQRKRALLSREKEVATAQ
jgi:AraC family transcriptional regulator, regulatory protein of adaptative response / methylated-DNA-[protein]-cysteine methyltransferase